MAKKNKDVDLMSWIMVIRNVPVADEHKPLLLGIYLAKPMKYLREGYFVDSFTSHYYGDYPDFIQSYKTNRGGRKARLKFLNEHEALRAVYRYRNGDKSLLNEGIEEFFDELGLDNLPKPDVQMSIVSENGEIGIQPHEYSVLSAESFKEYHGMIGHEYSVGFFDGKEEGNQDFEDKVFYLKTRGLSMNECIEALMGSITSQQMCYLKPHPELAESMGLASNSANSSSAI